ncbi:MAG: lipopolysaccharide transport periplasmic protein LptA [Gammaproteobacteria bacterium]|nr:MAG: lipopolysaccharide transport periplasmic protein LptA [Gammaproteobacteria bacterium]
MNRLWNRCLLLALILLPVDSWALSSDREQPMLIEADRAELDDANGISIYRGNVRVTQGTLLLTGDIMTVYTKGDDVKKVIMEGQPATYQQRPDNKDKDVSASALHMEYFTDPEKIILTKQAEVEQEGDVLRSERIEYDVPTDKVNAGTDQPNERVRITIQPRSGKKKTPAIP